MVLKFRSPISGHGLWIMCRIIFTYYKSKEQLEKTKKMPACIKRPSLVPRASSQCLKKTIHKIVRAHVLDDTFNAKINEFFFKWEERYTCRHYKNQNCHKGVEICPYIHVNMRFSTFKRLFMRAVQNLDFYFFDTLVERSYVNRWKSCQLLVDIRVWLRHTVHTLAQSKRINYREWYMTN